VGISILTTIDTGAILIGDRLQKSPSLSEDKSVWCAITGARIVGPILKNKFKSRSRAEVAQFSLVSDYRLNKKGSIPSKGKGFFL
jgi:hypothetical protein